MGDKRGRFPERGQDVVFDPVMGHPFHDVEYGNGGRDGPRIIIEGDGNAPEAGLAFLVVDREPAFPDFVQFVVEGLFVGDGVRGQRDQSDAPDDLGDVGLRHGGQQHLAGAGGVDRRAVPDTDRADPLGAGIVDIGKIHRPDAVHDNEAGADVQRIGEVVEERVGDAAEHEVVAHVAA